MRFWVLTAMAVVLSSPVYAQMDSREGIQLQNQILDLRNQIQMMQQNQGNLPPPRPRGGGDPGVTSGLTAQLLDRVNSLEDQVRQLTGQVQDLTNRQQRMTEDFNKQIGDLTFAMQNSGGGGAPAAPPPRIQSPPPNALGASIPPQPGQPLSGLSGGAPPPRTPEMAMQEGNAALARRDYPAAIAAAKEVVGKKGPRAADGQFLLAQAELGQRNFAQAAPDYYDAYNRARTGPHAADSLLGVANALIGVGDKNSACEALSKLRAEFPQPRSDVREGAISARQRAACR